MRNGLFLLLLWCVPCSMPGQANPLEGRIKKALTYAQTRLRSTVSMFGDSVQFPRSSDLKGVMQTVPPDDWTSGFFPGVLWYMAEYAHDTTLRVAADRWTRGLEAQKFNTGTHDVGFMMYCSYGNANRIEPSPDKQEILLRSARSLIKRYNPVVGCIKSWDGRKEWPYPVIIDNMMNLELLFWAAAHGGGPVFRDIAVSACPDDDGQSCPARRQHISRGGLRHAHRCGGEKADESGVCRRVGVGPRAGVGDLRIHHGVP